MSHSHEHGHDHDHEDDHGGDHGGGKGHAGHSHGAGAGERQLLIALLIAVGVTALEGIGGLLAGSLALMTDAVHMLADAAALGMSYAAIRAVRRPSTEVLSYGHHRWQVLAAFVNGLALIALSAWIVVEAAQRLLSPTKVDATTMMWIAGVGVAANLLAFLVLSGGGRSLNVRSALLHVASDMLGAIAALVAGAIIAATGWTPIDPLLSAVMALLIVRGGWRVTRESAHILLQGAPTGFEPERVERELTAAVPALVGIHDLHVWSLSDDQPIVTLHAVVKKGFDPDATLDQIKHALKDRLKVAHATVQIEKEVCDDKHADPAG